MSLLKRNGDIFDIFSDFDDRLSQRMKRFERLADNIFRHHDLDPFYELFEDEITAENQRSEQHKSQKQKENKQKKQEKKRQNREKIQQIKNEKESIFDLFSHYDKLFEERMKRFEFLTEKMFNKLGIDYFGNEIVSERKNVDKQQSPHQQQAQASNKIEEENQQKKLENNSIEIENQDKKKNLQQNKESEKQEYRSPFDIFNLFDEMFKERVERFERLTDKMFQKFEPQFVEQKKENSKRISKDNQAQEQSKQENRDQKQQMLQRRRSFDMFFRPFKFVDDIRNSEDENKIANFSQEHQRMTKGNKIQNQPSTIYSSTYSCLSKIDNDGKEIKEERHSAEYTERDTQGNVITKSRHKVIDNGNEMEIEERILDGKGVRKIVTKGIDGKCEEKTLLHNMKNEDIQQFEDNWKQKQQENNFAERAYKSLSAIDLNSEKKAINDH